MSYFTQDYLDFMAGLAVNNNKAWFDEHRSEYEKYVREPFLAFTDDLITAIQQMRPDIVLPANKALFRINRDIRFSKDKTPYKTNMSCMLNASKKDEQPGFYAAVGIENGLTLAGGMYQPSTESLQAIRMAIINNEQEFLALVNDKSFKKHWGELQGDKNKVLPKEFKQAAETNNWLFNKQWYFWVNLPFETVLQDKEALIKLIMDHYQAGQKLNQFFKKHM